MYDADAYAPCRYHLLQRAEVQTALLSPNISGSEAEAAEALPPLPGTASRWRMQADATGLDRHAHMVHRVHSMYQVYTLYYFLQVLTCELGREEGRF